MHPGHRPDARKEHLENVFQNLTCELCIKHDDELFGSAISVTIHAIAKLQASITIEAASCNQHR